MADQRYHLWRLYHEQPIARFACTVVQTTAAHDGFKVVDYDDSIADAHFLHQLADTLRSGQWVNDGEVLADGTAVSRSRYTHPGDPMHFGVAIRAVPDTVLRGEGRP